MNDNMYNQAPSNSGFNRDRGTGGSQSTRTDMQNRASGYSTERHVGSGITGPASTMLRQARRAEQGSTPPARTLTNSDAAAYSASAQAHERRMQAQDKKKRRTQQAPAAYAQDPLGTSQQAPGAAPQPQNSINAAPQPQNSINAAPQPESTSGVGEGWRNAGVGEGWRDADVAGDWRGQKPVNEQPIMQVPDPYQGMGGFAPQPMADESNVEFMQPLPTFGRQHTTSLYEDPLLGY